MPVLKIILSLGYSDRCAVTSLFQRFATVQTHYDHSEAFDLGIIREMQFLLDPPATAA